jgi:hypothetical protein
MNDIEQILDDCLEQMATGESSLEGCLESYPHEAAELEPMLRAAVGLGYGREIRIPLGFKARTRADLVRYMQAHPRGGRGAGPSVRVWPFWRITLSLALVLAFLLVSGTAYSQRAIPGDSFYEWKLTSEQAWRLVASDPVGLDLTLAGRRMNEYLSVANDPARSVRALRGYGEVLVRLQSETDNQTRGRIVPVLEDHARSLKDTGILIPQLDDLIREETGDITSPASSLEGLGVNGGRPADAGNSHQTLPDPRGRP